MFELDYYKDMDRQTVAQRIEAARQALGDDVVILGHHYQSDDVIEHTDFTGDSFLLARQAAERSTSRYIVFCGVHFMAETADILTPPDRAVLLPEPEAGCSMADMATIGEVEECYRHLEQAGHKVVPITYMNSSAAIKAFCGRHGGIVCTSSNAQRAFDWALDRGDCILFLPDEHLGRNAGKQVGIFPKETAKWHRASGTLKGASEPRLVVWDGFCSVHLKFTVEQMAQARLRYAGVNVIVHPECPQKVVDAADDVGSTEYIIRRVSEGPPGSSWAVGTEINLVNRLAKKLTDRTVFSLNPVVSPCPTMYLVTAAHLLALLEALVEGNVRHRIVVPAEVAGPARIALDRMLKL